MSISTVGGKSTSSTRKGDPTAARINKQQQARRDDGASPVKHTRRMPFRPPFTHKPAPKNTQPAADDEDEGRHQRSDTVTQRETQTRRMTTERTTTAPLTMRRHTTTQRQTRRWTKTRRAARRLPTTATTQRHLRLRTTTTATAAQRARQRLLHPAATTQPHQRQARQLRSARRHTTTQRQS